MHRNKKREQLDVELSNFFACSKTLDILVSSDYLEFAIHTKSLFLIKPINVFARFQARHCWWVKKLEILPLYHFILLKLNTLTIIDIKQVQIKK